MHDREVGALRQYLEGRTGETLGLADWCCEINSKGITRRRWTTRQLAYVIHRRLKDVIEFEHNSCPVQYTFFRMDRNGRVVEG